MKGVSVMNSSVPEEQKAAFNQLLFDLQNLVIASKSSDPIEINNALDLIDMSIERLKTIESSIQNIDQLLKNIEDLRHACSHEKWDQVTELNDIINKQIFEILS